MAPVPRQRFVPPSGWTPPAIHVRDEPTADSELSAQYGRIHKLFPDPGSREAFFASISTGVLDMLYSDHPHAAPTFIVSITWVFADFDGLAHMQGDAGHKEIHLSLRYLRGVRPGGDLAVDDLQGIMWHEMTHVWQLWNGAPWGFTEGLADVVRLQAGFPGDGWSAKRDLKASWDAGYSTTAYLLLWIENQASPPSPGFVMALNAAMHSRPWSMELVSELSGGNKPMHVLWREYQAALSTVPIIWPPASPAFTADSLNGKTVRLRSVQQPSACLASTPSSSSGSLCLLYGASQHDEPVSSAHWILQLSPDGPPYYIIFHPLTGQVLDLPNWSRDNSTKLALWTGNGGANQQWEIGQLPFEDASGCGIVPDRHWDKYYIKSRHSGKALDVAGGTSDIIQWDFHGGDNQCWLIEVV
ncbi:peptidase of plants and bacteria-domain-containing protein, partial [Entophlyctis helioformis]